MKRLFLTVAVLALLAGGAMAGTVNGVVTDSTGAPVEGAHVMLTVPGDWTPPPHRPQRPHRPRWHRMNRMFAVTEADGSYSFEDVPEGHAWIRAGLFGVGRAFDEVDVPEEGTVTVNLQLECLYPEGPRGGRRGGRGGMGPFGG